MVNVRGKDRKQENILGVNIDSTPRIEVLRIIKRKIRNIGTNSLDIPEMIVVTPNPEQILLAQQDNEFKKILNSSDIAVPDGFGLALAKAYLTVKLPRIPVVRQLSAISAGIFIGTKAFIQPSYFRKYLEVIKGRELFIDLNRMANEHGWRVFLVGGRNRVAADTTKILSGRFKRAIYKSADGPELDNRGLPIGKQNQDQQQEIITAINAFQPHLLFVAFQNPKQEKWLYRLKGHCRFGAGMVVGGTFDYLAGTTRMPPKILAKRGMEWFWRLITQPRKRLKRIWNAVVVFPWTVYRYKITNLD